MSRNLCQTDCHECPGGSEHIAIEGPIRPVTAKEDPTYFRDHAGLLIAEARCVLCHALYFAWIDWPGSPHHMWQLDRHEGARFVDLSFRHSFNDEPSVLDLPVYKVRAVTRYERESFTAHPYFSERNVEGAAAFKARWAEAVNSGKTVGDELRALPSESVNRG